MKIVTWNIKGASSLGWNMQYKIESKLVDKILEQTADVIVLTEFVITKGIDYLLERFQNEGYIWFQENRSGKNGILIAIKKELLDDKRLIENIYKENVISSAIDGCNMLKITFPLKCGKNFCVIGCRMETCGMSPSNYECERNNFDNILIPNIPVEDDLCVICGDFNNAKHYGEINSTFEEVEEKYWTQDYDQKNKCYVGERYKRAQYEYNLHKIQDKLKEYSFVLCEKEDDYTFVDKYENFIHEDHIFVKGFAPHMESGILYLKKLSDHCMLWAEVEINES